MNDMTDCFYRVSVKALILNETRDKFLICEEENGMWDLPGGGLDFGATPQEDLPREIMEELGLQTTWVADVPSYFVTDRLQSRSHWKACVLYEATVEHLDFTPSSECVSVRFVNAEDVATLPVFACVKKVADLFDPTRHQ